MFVIVLALQLEGAFCQYWKNVHCFKNIPPCHWWNPKEPEGWKGWCSLKTPTGSLEGWVTEPCSTWSIHGKSRRCRRILLSQQGAEIHRNILLSEALQKRICFLLSNLVVHAGQLRAFWGHVHKRSSQLPRMMPVECEEAERGSAGSLKPYRSKSFNRAWKTL